MFLSELVRTVSGVLLVALSPAAMQVSGPPCTATEEAKLSASDPQASDSFGFAVAISGDTLAIGAVNDDHSGATDAGSVYVFVRSGTSWSEEAWLTASDPETGASFGTSVALSGNTLIVGAIYDNHSGLSGPGSAYVFLRNGTTWSEQAKLTASHPANYANLGRDVALAGDTALVAAKGEASAYVFVRSGTLWTEQAKLTVSRAVAEGFGHSVALAGDTALVGAREDHHSGNSQAGSAYVFVRNGTSWSEQQMLTASDSEAWDYFGGSVALEGDTALVGAIGGDNLGLGKYAGAAYVFVRNLTSWSEEAKLSPSDPVAGDHFGIAVALRENRAVVGAQLDKTGYGPPAGSAYVFARNGAMWSQQGKLVASDGANSDYFGYAVAVWGDTALVGAFADDNGQGSAYVLGLSLPPSVATYCTAGTSGNGCQSMLSGCGVPSASAPSGFNIQAWNVEGGKDGYFFFGTSGQQANPWGNTSSFLCVVPPVVRTGNLEKKGVQTTCTGYFSQDLNSFWCPTCPKPQKNPGAGAVVQAQLWYRDPWSSSNQLTSLSDAIQFVLDP